MSGRTEGIGAPVTTEHQRSNEQHEPIVIEPTKGWAPLKIKELWEFRELIGFLAKRDISSRYKETVLGAGWAIIQPLLMVLVFSVFFGKLAKMPSDGIPYPLFSYCGMLPWQFFVNGTTKAAASLVLNANMLTKVYFPRMVIPISAVLPALLDFAIAFVILLGLIFYYHIAVTVNWLFLPIFFLIALVTALAMGIWLSALGMAYRDVRHTVGLLMTAWMYISPVIYPSSMIPPQWRALYSLNPMVAAIEGFRWSLLGKPALNVEGTLVAASVSLLLLITGAYYFRRVERRFADVI